MLLFCTCSLVFAVVVKRESFDKFVEVAKQIQVCLILLSCKAARFVFARTERVELVQLHWSSTRAFYCDDRLASLPSLKVGLRGATLGAQKSWNQEFWGAQNFCRF